MRASFVDLHCDTLLTLQQEHCGLENAPGHINLEKLQQGGALLQCLAIFIPDHECAVEYGITESPWEFFHSQYALYSREMERFPDTIRPARSMADIRRNEEAGVISALLTVEDGACVEGKMERLQALYDAGVRLLTLTWNYVNCFGHPNSPDPALHKLGLTAFGREAVQEMNCLGMVVDVSHLSEGGFWDVVKHGKKPFIASHSCARALSDHRRNLTDEQLRALGEKGGVCGVNFCDAFLRLDSDMTTVDDIVRHAIHIADKAGIDAVAMGSDFDGIGDNLEFKDFAGFPMIVDGLAKRFSSADVDKICHGNALRVFKDVIG